MNNNLKVGDYVQIIELGPWSKGINKWSKNLKLHHIYKIKCIHEDGKMFFEDIPADRGDSSISAEAVQAWKGPLIYAAAVNSSSYKCRSQAS